MRQEHEQNKIRTRNKVKIIGTKVSYIHYKDKASNKASSKATNTAKKQKRKQQYILRLRGAT